MTTPRHWLQGVEAILNAETEDLRRLAELAGEDPTTLYIGTRLDGADLRGQDLRGMQLTHLEISKVRRDTSTLLDPKWEGRLPEDTLVVSDVEEVAGLVLVRSTRTATPSSMPLPTGQTLEVFGPDQTQRFHNRCRRFGGPKFVVLEHSRRDGLADLLEPFDAGTVTLVVRRGDFRFLADRDLNAATTLPGPVVIVPALGMETFGGQPALGGAPLDAIRIFIANWDLLLSHFERRDLSVFFRGKAAPSDSESDAWCRVITNLQRGGLMDYEGLCLVGRTLPSMIERIDRVVLPDLAAEEAELEVAPRVAAAVLIDPTAPRHSSREPYVSALRSLLSAHNWQVGPRAVTYDSSPLPPAFFRVPEFMIEGAAWAARVLTPDGNLPRLARVGFSADSDVPFVDFTAVRTLVANEFISDGAVVFQLANHQVLCVSIRDLANVDGASGNIWSLVAEQLRRIGRSNDDVGRTQYLWLLATAAVSQGRAGGAQLAPFLKALDAPSFAARHRMRCGGVKRVGPLMTTIVKLDGVAGVAGRNMPLEARLSIDANGVALSDVA